MAEPEELGDDWTPEKERKRDPGEFMERWVKFADKYEKLMDSLERKPEAIGLDAGIVGGNFVPSFQVQSPSKVVGLTVKVIYNGILFSVIPDGHYGQPPQMEIFVESWEELRDAFDKLLKPGIEQFFKTLDALDKESPGAEKGA